MLIQLRSIQSPSPRLKGDNFLNFLLLAILAHPNDAYLFAIYKPANISGRKRIIAGAIEINPVPQVVGMAFIAGNHREPLRKANYGQTASVLDKFKWWRIHGDLTHKVARCGQFYFL